ncbi:MAG: hypothetical protein ABSA78_17225 [Candidatus Sulfotelmatobacter sp.]|jgi:hypothetical protein
MAVLKLFLSPQVDVPDEVLDAAGKRLKRYFDSICLAMNPRKFSGAIFKVSPHSAEVADGDLVVYITQSSSILRLMDKVFEPDVQHQLPSAHGGGGTKQMPDGRVLSEVYWTGGLMALKRSYSDTRGVALANLIFHEWAHNKHASDPLALSKGEVNGDYVHTDCGGGVLSARLSYGMAATLDITSENIRCMARVLGAANKQSISGLYSDEYGF